MESPPGGGGGVVTAQVSQDRPSKSFVMAKTSPGLVHLHQDAFQYQTQVGSFANQAVTRISLYHRLLGCGQGGGFPPRDISGHGWAAECHAHELGTVKPFWSLLLEIAYNVPWGKADSTQSHVSKMTHPCQVRRRTIFPSKMFVGPQAALK